jgi:uncharacterized protein YwgA
MWLVHLTGNLYMEYINAVVKFSKTVFDQISKLLCSWEQNCHDLKRPFKSQQVFSKVYKTKTINSAVKDLPVKW